MAERRREWRCGGFGDFLVSRVVCAGGRLGATALLGNRGAVCGHGELLPAGIETGNAIATFLQFACQFLPICRVPGVEMRRRKNLLQPNDFFFCHENGRFHSLQFAFFLPFEFARLVIPVAWVGAPGARSALLTADVSNAGLRIPTRAGVSDPGYRARPFFEVVVVIADGVLDDAVALEGENGSANSIQKIAVVADNDRIPTEGDERFLQQPQRLEIEIIGSSRMRTLPPRLRIFASNTRLRSPPLS